MRRCSLLSTGRPQAEARDIFRQLAARERNPLKAAGVFGQTAADLFSFPAEHPAHNRMAAGPTLLRGGAGRARPVPLGAVSCYNPDALAPPPAWGGGGALGEGLP